MCSLNVTIPSSMTVTWSHNGTATPPNEVSTAGSTTTLVIRNPQPSDAGVYQCVFNDSVNGWMLKRNVSGIYFYVSLCVGGSKGKAGIQLKCIPEKRDTNSCILGKWSL